MSSAHRFTILVSLAVLTFAPFANAIPVLYSFTGELTSFSSRLDGVTRTIDSLASREIRGFVAYDTDRLEFGAGDEWILRSGLSGDGFEFEANSARIGGSQAIFLREESDTAVFFEFFEYEMLNRIFTSDMRVDLFGDGLIGPANTLNVGRFEGGEGTFGGGSVTVEGEFPSSIGGAFAVTQLWAGPVRVPEPAPIWLMMAALVGLTIGSRRRAATG